MMTKKDFTVGQEVILRNIEDTQYYNELFVGKVEKIGTVYLTVRLSDDHTERFFINHDFAHDTESDYSPGYILYLTKDDAERDIQSEKKREKLYDALTHRAIIWDIPEEKINQIYRILFGDHDPEQEEQKK